MNLTSICLTSCYFGALPPYMELVLKSMAANTTIDWLLVTDAEIPWTLPHNVKIRRETLESMTCLLEETTGERVTVATVYDITRLKPFFGRVLQSDLKAYSFWGHVDLDMIFGDLRKFVTEEILATHDRVFSRGHLCLYRNVDRIHEAFKLSAPGAVYYKDVVSKKVVLPFDEWDGVWKIFRYHGIPQYHRECIADIIPSSNKIVRRFEASEITNHPHQFFYWMNGKACQAYHHREGGILDREVAYIHFQKRKLPAPIFDPAEVTGFSIGPLGFKPYHMENLSVDEMDALNPERKVPWTALWGRRISKRLPHILRKPNT
jgi:hypothetical protein